MIGPYVGLNPMLLAVFLLAKHRHEGRGGGNTVRITSGIRGYSEQRKLVDDGKSRSMSSRHLLGEAIDVFVNGTWDWEAYEDFADLMERAAKDFGVQITWGGYWKSRDGVHFQIET